MKTIKFNIFILILIDIFRICYINCIDAGEQGSKNPDNLCQNGSCSEKEKRYILYEVNPGEGFNLRRDIYIRIAPLIHSLNEEDVKYKWILVLPPWGRLPHWRHTDSSTLFNWKTFFDMEKIRQYIPAIELHEYLEEYGFDNHIDIVYQLQHFPFEEPMLDWTERIETNVTCQDRFGYKFNQTLGYYTGYFWGQKILAREAMCIALRGQASTLKIFLQESDAKSIMFDRAEVILWDHYGGKDWWEARISLKFANNLTEAAKQFLKEHKLSSIVASLPAIPKSVSTDSVNSKTEKRKYIGVHLRRRDFLLGRQKDLPSLEGTAKQILQICEQESLSDVLIATDADNKDIKELKSWISNYSQPLLPTKMILLHKYPCQLQQLSDGECAIIDQILCSYSNYFIGTKDSTFTSRIYEEREILGIKSEKTYNILCPDDETDAVGDPNQPTCKKPTRWRIPNSISYERLLKDY